VIDPPHGFGRDELAILRRLKTPERIQSFLDSEIGYNKEPQGATCRSPRRVLRDRLAHCMEGALIAAAALRVHGFPPLLLDLEAVRDDTSVRLALTQLAKEDPNQFIREQSSRLLAGTAGLQW